VWVLKLRGDLDFSSEPAPVNIGNQLGREDLDDSLSSQRPIDRDEHPAHSSTAELALDVVGVGQGLFQLLFEGAH